MQCSNLVLQFKACSDILFCARSRTSGSSLTFLTFTLVRAILLQAVDNCSSFQIQLSISHFYLQALSSLFGNFHRKSARFHEPQYGRIPLDYKPLAAFRSLFKS